MSVTISTTPTQYSSRAVFVASTNQAEDSTHVNVRIEAQLMAGSTIVAKKTNPKVLTTFDFTDILRSFIKFTNPTPFTNPAAVDVVSPTKSGSNLLTSWANKTSYLWTNFTSSGANISVCNGTPVGTNMMCESNDISFVDGTIYVLLWKNKTLSGTPYIEIGSTGATPLGTYSNYISAESIEPFNGQRFYFLCKSTGTYKLTIGAKAGDGAASLVGDFELYAMSSQDWYKQYSIKFVEKWEDASGVTQTGATGDNFKLYTFFKSSESETRFNSMFRFFDFTWTNSGGFATFTSVGQNITSAINTAGAYRSATVVESIDIKNGESITLQTNLTLNSGIAPYIWLYGAGEVKSNTANLSAGANIVKLTSTYTGIVTLHISVTNNSDFSLSSTFISSGKYLFPDAYFEGTQRSVQIVKTPTNNAKSTAQLMAVLSPRIYNIDLNGVTLAAEDVYSPIVLFAIPSSVLSASTNVYLMYNGTNIGGETLLISLNSKCYPYHKALQWVNQIGGISQFFFGDDYKQKFLSQKDTYEDSNRIKRIYASTPIEEITLSTQFLARDETATYLKDVISSLQVMESTDVFKEVFIQDEEMPIREKGNIITADVTYQYGS